MGGTTVIDADCDAGNAASRRLCELDTVGVARTGVVGVRSFGGSGTVFDASWAAVCDGGAATAVGVILYTPVDETVAETVTILVSVTGAAGVGVRESSTTGSSVTDGVTGTGTGLSC